MNKRIHKALWLMLALLSCKVGLCQTSSLETTSKKILAAKRGDIVNLDKVLKADFPKLSYTKSVLPGPQYIISDDPEYIRVPEAIALQETVDPGAVRLYVYNVNGVKDPQKIARKISAVIKNLGKENMHFRMLKYSSQKPSSNYFEIGKKGLEDYFLSAVSNQVRVLKPGEVMAIDEKLENQIVQYDELVHGFYEFVVDQPAQISVIQFAPEESGPKVLSHIKTLIPHSHANAGRGIFPISNYQVNTVDTLDTKNGVVQLIVADGQDDPWITGTIGEKKEFAKNAGNYGVMYKNKIKWRSSDGKGLALVTWNSRSADNQWCGGMGLTMELIGQDGKKTVMQYPNKALITKGYPEAILIETYWPDPKKEIQDIEFTYSPPGASCLPTPLIFIPIDRKK
ncbi:copper amine oxidase [Sphingobacterium thalpophilum]|uniref:copper amine oxidase n=1 Tax=Sphingobacterium thalpophilum TaxID=259 RepID=UPI0031DB6CF7